MALYAQQVEGGAGVESPTAQVDYSGASRIGAAIGSLFGRPATGGSGQSQDDQRQGQLTGFLFEEAERARAMMEQGDPAMARALFNRSRVAFAQAGGELDANARAQLESITGTSEEQFLVSPTERAVTDFLRTDEGQGFVVLAAMQLGADATEDQVQNAALSMKAESVLNNQILQRVEAAGAQGELAWRNGGEQAYIDVVITPFQLGTLGALETMQERGIQPTDADVDKALLQFEALTSAATPTNLSADQRTTLTARLDNVRRVLQGIKDAPDRDFVVSQIVALKSELSSTGGFMEIDAELLEKLGAAMNINSSVLLGMDNTTDIVAYLEEKSVPYRAEQTRLVQEFNNEVRIARLVAAAGADGTMPANTMLEPDQMPYAEPMDTQQTTDTVSMIHSGLSDLLGNIDNPAAVANATQHVAGLGGLLYHATDEFDVGTLEMLIGPNSPLSAAHEAWLESGSTQAAVANATLRTGIQAQQRAISARVNAIHDENRKDEAAVLRDFPNAVYDESRGVYVDRDTGQTWVDPTGDTRRDRSGQNNRVVELNAQLDVLDRALNRFAVKVPESTTDESGITTTDLGQRGPTPLPEEVAADTGFLNAVTATSERLGVSSDDLLKVIAFETAGTWSPSVRNPGSTATGLIQFLSSTARGLGTTTEDLANMTREEQMVYVEKYLAPYAGRLNNLGDVYMAVHWPAGVGKPDDYVMYSQGSAQYDVNRNLDVNGDGVITRGEAIARVQGVDTSSMRGFNTAPGERSGPADSAATTAALNRPATGGGVRQPQGQPASQQSATANTTSADSQGSAPQAAATPPRRASTTADAPVSSEVAGSLTAIAGGSFDTPEEAEAAFERGDLKVGDIIMLNGVRVRVDDGDF